MESEHPNLDQSSLAVAQDSEVPMESPKDGWLHPTSILFDLISNGRQNLVPALVGIFGAANGNWGWAIFALVIFSLGIMTSAFRYFTLRYRIYNGELTVRQGLIFKRIRTVPLKRIQNIDSTQNVLHRIFGVAEVRVETASGNEPEAILRVLSLGKIADLRETVMKMRPIAATDPAAMTPEDDSSREIMVDEIVDKVASETLLHEISLENLLKAGIASNRGLLVFGVLAGLYFQFDLEKQFDVTKLFDLLPQNMGILQTAISIMAALILIFILIRLYGAVWYVLRFYGYQLRQQNEDFKISCGLFTRVSATVPRKRIQFISVHRSLFMRLFKLASIRIETAGGSGVKVEDATSSVSRRWFIPVIEESKVNLMLSQLRPGLEWQPDEVEWIGVAPRTATRLCRIACIQALVIAAIGFGISQAWGWIAGIVVLPLLLWLAIKQSRAMRLTETDFGVAYRSGVLTKKLSLTFFNRIQTISLEQSPFDRRWGMATLCVDTAAAGPADHRVHVKYLDSVFARTKFSSLRQKLDV